MLSFSYEMSSSWMKPWTELSLFLRVFLPTLATKHIEKGRILKFLNDRKDIYSIRRIYCTNKDRDTAKKNHLDTATTQREVISQNDLYSRTSMARIVIARLPRLFRNSFLSSLEKSPSPQIWDNIG